MNKLYFPFSAFSAFLKVFSELYKNYITLEKSGKSGKTIELLIVNHFSHCNTCILSLYTFFIKK